MFRMELYSRNIFQAEEAQDINEVYIFRGLICYQYSHYCTFVYVPEEKSWYQIDDSFIKKLDNFKKICDMINRNESVPVLLLYEKDYGQYTRKIYKKEAANNSMDTKQDRSCLNCKIF